MLPTTKEPTMTTTTSTPRFAVVDAFGRFGGNRTQVYADFDRVEQARAYCRRGGCQIIRHFGSLEVGDVVFGDSIGTTYARIT